MDVYYTHYILWVYDEPKTNLLDIFGCNSDNAKRFRVDFTHCLQPVIYFSPISDRLQVALSRPKYKYLDCVQTHNIGLTNNERDIIQILCHRATQCYVILIVYTSLHKY